MATDAQNPWIYAGRGDAFADITPPSQKDLEESQVTSLPSACRILQLSSSASTSTPSSSCSVLDTATATATLPTTPQVLIFRYRGALYAIDHACPHAAFPLSAGALYDIEDFGVVLSAGIQCPKHDWAFDLHTGRSDRGNYRLNVWEVEVRGGENGFGEREEEVWVRRRIRKRIG